MPSGLPELARFPRFGQKMQRRVDSCAGERAPIVRQLRLFSGRLQRNACK